MGERDSKGRFINKAGPGRPKKDPELAKAEKFTRTESRQLLVKFMAMDIDELEAVLKDKKRKVIEHIIGRIALMAIKNGDHARLNFVFEQIMGKLTDKVEHSLPKPTVIRARNGETITLGATRDDDGAD